MEDPDVGQCLFPPCRVGVERVAAVDDDVALVEQRHEISEHGVDDLARLDHQHDPTGPIDHADQLLQRRRRDHSTR
jgi:hypothetical protein